MIWPWKKHINPVAETYLAATPGRVPRKTPLPEIKFVALDSETTGFNLTQDRMLSLALIEVSGGRVQMTRAISWMIYQQNAAITPAVSVHGILPGETAHGRQEADVLLELLPRLHGAVIVGHHVAFDAGMLNAALQRHLRLTLKNPLLDTGRLAMDAIDAFAKSGYPGQRVPTLEELCAECEVPPMERHTAEGDAFTTAVVFLMLCARLQRRLGRPLRASDLPLAKA